MLDFILNNGFARTVAIFVVTLGLAMLLLLFMGVFSKKKSDTLQSFIRSVKRKRLNTIFLFPLNRLALVILIIYIIILAVSPTLVVTFFLRNVDMPEESSLRNLMNAFSWLTTIFNLYMIGTSIFRKYIKKLNNHYQDLKQRFRGIRRSIYALKDMQAGETAPNFSYIEMRTFLSREFSLNIWLMDDTRIRAHELQADEVIAEGAQREAEEEMFEL